MAEAAEKKAVRKKPGRKPPPGAEDRRQFLAVMDAKVIKGIKVAAAEEDVTASVLLERIAKEFLDRRKSTRSRRT
ncbi:hypothetical protein ABIF69_003257 [Bradyrhizobium japonicum]